MFCIKSGVTIEETIKKSRFIGIVITCRTEKEILYHLNQIQQKHPNANHIVFAYRIKTEKGIIMRFHDAGEPSGTAGKPVYQHIEGKNLINILCVVVRYFGGIKLGAGGLTRAYSNAAKKAIEACNITEFIEYAEVKLELDYNQMQLFEHQLEKLNGSIVNQQFSANIALIIKIPEQNLADLTELSDTLNRQSGK